MNIENLKENTCVIIGSYPTSLEHNAMLNLTAFAAKKNGYDVCLVSHQPLSTDIQKHINYYIYSDENDTSLINSGEIYGIYSNLKFIKYCSNYHSYPILKNIQNALSLLKEKSYTNFIYFESDEFLNKFDFINLENKLLENDFLNKDYWFMNDGYDNQTIFPVTSMFGGNINYFYNLLKNIKTIEDYKNIFENPNATTLEFLFHYLIPDIDKNKNGCFLSTRPRDWVTSEWSGISSVNFGSAIPGYKDFITYRALVKFHNNENKIVHLIYLNTFRYLYSTLDMYIYKNDDLILSINDLNENHWYLNDFDTNIDDVWKIEIKSNNNIVNVLNKTTVEILNSNDYVIEF